MHLGWCPTLKNFFSKFIKHFYVKYIFDNLTIAFAYFFCGIRLCSNMEFLCLENLSIKAGLLLLPDKVVLR